VSKLEWSVDAASGMVAIPPNPDTQIESTVVQENIKLNRAWPQLSVLTFRSLHHNRAGKDHLALGKFDVIRLVRSSMYTCVFMLVS
jgi:hypothetical protein